MEGLPRLPHLLPHSTGHPIVSEASLRNPTVKLQEFLMKWGVDWEHVDQGVSVDDLVHQVEPLVAVFINIEGRVHEHLVLLCGDDIRVVHCLVIRGPRHLIDYLEEEK